MSILNSRVSNIEKRAVESSAVDEFEPAKDEGFEKEGEVEEEEERKKKMTRKVKRKSLCRTGK